MWWQRHLVIIGMQIIAFVPYIVGSRRFYQNKDKFMTWISLGILLDILMAISPFIFELPRMESNQSAPWNSALFIIHIGTASIGMFGFLIMFLYLWINGTDYPYKKLRIFQYLFLLRLWIFGVSIALLNFIIKVAFNIRIYDYI